MLGMGLKMQAAIITGRIVSMQCSAFAIPLSEDAIKNQQRTTGVNPWLNAEIRNWVRSSFKCHGRKPAGIYYKLFEFESFCRFRLSVGWYV
jgi:hypothetical protein